MPREVQVLREAVVAEVALPESRPALKDQRVLEYWRLANPG